MRVTPDPAPPVLCFENRENRGLIRSDDPCPRFPPFLALKGPKEGGFLNRGGGAVIPGTRTGKGGRTGERGRWPGSKAWFALMLAKPAP